MHPSRIQDCVTARIDVSTMTVRRMFEEAAIIEAIERVESTQDIRQELRRVVADLAVIW